VTAFGRISKAARIEKLLFFNREYKSLKAGAAINCDIAWHNQTHVLMSMLKRQKATALGQWLLLT
jgi:hypothetical protein